MREHVLTAEPTHSVWDRPLSPRLHIESGDEVQIACVDASGSQVYPGMGTDESRRMYAATADSGADGWVVVETGTDLADAAGAATNRIG